VTKCFQTTWYYVITARRCKFAISPVRLHVCHTHALYWTPFNIKHYFVIVPVPLIASHMTLNVSSMSFKFKIEKRMLAQATGKDVVDLFHTRPNVKDSLHHTMVVLCAMSRFPATCIENNPTSDCSSEVETAISVDGAVSAVAEADTIISDVMFAERVVSREKSCSADQILYRSGDQWQYLTTVSEKDSKYPADGCVCWRLLTLI